MESLKYFDKDTIRLAASRSYKISPVKVGGISHAAVPMSFHPYLSVYVHCLFPVTLPPFERRGVLFFF
jgi:hypothetical protein